MGTLPWIIQVSPKCNHKGLCGEGQESRTQERLCKVAVRHWSDVSWRQGTLAASGRCWKRQDCPFLLPGRKSRVCSLGLSSLVSLSRLK